MKSRSLQLADGTNIPLDEKGYLCNRACWTPAVAEALAAADGVVLGEDHWAVIRMFQDFFDEYEVEPTMRALVRRVAEQLGSDKANSRFLYALFPDGPILQATRYAGLPRPLSCI
jgi:TusE/DsrC/DsvC family sulfur relay protein